ncbi:MAG: S9 family peptidase [Halorhabdus sp.]
MSDTTLERLARLPSFYHPVASPAGDRIAYYYDGTGQNELYVQDLATGDRRQISDGEVPRNARWPIRWRPDGQAIYFHRDEGGNEQNDIYELTLDGDLRSVVTLDGQTILTDVTDDGRLYVASDADEQLNLYGHDPETDETTRYTSYDHAVGAALASPDGERLAFTVNETDDRHNEDVYVARADASDPRNLQLGETGSETTVADWFPDGQSLLVGDNAADVDRCGVYDLEAEEVTWYGGEAVEEPVTVLPGGQRFLALRTRDAAVVPVVYDLDGEGRELDLPEGVASVPRYGKGAIVDDDRVLVTHEAPGRRKGLFEYDRRTDERRTIVEPDYGEFEPDAFADAEFVTFESHDGLEIEALLYDGGKRPSPAVVKVHGGPLGQDQRDFDRYAQFLALEGYSVLEVNYRGSTGRGRAFERRLDMDWGGAEQGDVAAGTRWLADREWIDENRIAVFGGSYGGYSAYMQLLQYPELYACGVAWIGLTDLHAMYEESMPHYRTELLERYMGDPEEHHERWRDRSPIEHVENLAAPLLMVHGVNDSRVPISQARLFRDALEDAGYEAGPDGDFEYEELGEEGHGSTDTEQQLRAFRLVADFLDRRL